MCYFCLMTRRQQRETEPRPKIFVLYLPYMPFSVLPQIVFLCVYITLGIFCLKTPKNYNWCLNLPEITFSSFILLESGFLICLKALPLLLW